MKSDVPHVIVKLNIEKAYDHVNWMKAFISIKDFQFLSMGLMWVFW